MEKNYSTDVLIIDDDQVHNFITETMIKKTEKNIGITVCLNGQEAIEKLLHIKANNGKLPEFILLDLAMPVMDGWGFLDEYNRLNIDSKGQSKIFVVSSSIFKRDIERALKHATVSQYISKPVSREVMHRILEVDVQGS
ncbi:MAG TPA: response regulator [Mucilaginibacter sp.]